MTAAPDILSQLPQVETADIAVGPSTDFLWLQRMIRASESYELTADDSCPPAAQLDTRGFEWARALLLKVRRRGVAVGAFLLMPIPYGYEVHTLLTRQCRGARALEAGRQGIAFTFQHTSAQRITSRCPETNPASLWFALRNGFEIVDRRADWVKHGRAYNSVYVELTRNKWRNDLCQSQQ